MTSAVAVPVLDEPRVEGQEIPEEEMESRPQTNGFGFSFANVLVAVAALILGIVGGLLASVASNSEWKGRMEQRMDNYEKQRSEDKQTWDHIRAQNEVNGRDLSEIRTLLNGLLQSNGKRR